MPDKWAPSRFTPHLIHMLIKINQICLIGLWRIVQLSTDNYRHQGSQLRLRFMSDYHNWSDNFGYLTWWRRRCLWLVCQSSHRRGRKDLPCVLMYRSEARRILLRYPLRSAGLGWTSGSILLCNSSEGFKDREGLVHSSFIVGRRITDEEDTCC